jgi:hypothetical protein
MPERMLQTGFDIGETPEPAAPELLQLRPEPGPFRSFLLREGWPFVLSVGLVYVTFLIQLLGFAFTNPDFDPIVRPAPPAWRFIGEMGLDMSTLAPLLGLFVIYIIRTPVAYETVPAERRFVWGVALVSLILAFAEFWLSWNGHPTWLRGYVS